MFSSCFFRVFSEKVIRTKKLLSRNHPGNPNPKWSCYHKKQDAECQRRSTSPFVKLVLITDDNARKSRRQGTCQDHHLELVGFHVKKQSDYQQDQRHQYQLLDGIVHHFLVQLELHATQSQTGRKDRYTGVSFSNQFEVRVEYCRKLDIEQHQDYCQNWSPTHRFLQGIYHRIRLLSTRCSHISLSLIHQSKSNRDVDGIHHNGDNSHHQTCCCRSSINRFQHGESQETDGVILLPLRLLKGTSG